MRGGVGKEMAAIYSTDKHSQPCMAPSAMQVYTNTATLIGASAPNCINKDAISTHVRTYVRTHIRTYVLYAWHYNALCINANTYCRSRVGPSAVSTSFLQEVMGWDGR